MLDYTTGAARRVPDGAAVAPSERHSGRRTQWANRRTVEERHMAMSRWNDPADEERNPHRAEERRHARDELEARLRERRIELIGDESDEDVLLIVNAVETFEGRLALLG